MRFVKMDFEKIYHKNFNQIYGFCYRILGDTESAKDITQETFFKLFDKMQTNGKLENYSAWLYRVAINTCKDYLRKKKNYQRVFKSLQYEHHCENNLDEEYIRGEKIAKIRSALSKLPTRDQMLIQLNQDGLSYAEIASALQIKKTSVGKLLSRAIQKCANIVRGDYTCHVLKNK